MISITGSARRTINPTQGVY